MKTILTLLLLGSASYAGDPPTRTRLPNGSTVRTRPLGNSTVITLQDTTGRMRTAIARPFGNSSAIITYRDGKGVVRTTTVRR